MKYEYEPSNSYWSEQDIESFKKDFFTDIKKFFNNSEVQEAVIKNDWDKVFEIWDSNEELNPKSIAEVLAFFLYYFADIDFMKYIKNPYNYSIFEEHIIEIE